MFVLFICLFGCVVFFVFEPECERACVRWCVRDCVCTLCVLLLNAFSLDCEIVADSSSGVVVGVSNSDLNVGYAVGGL